MTKKFNASSGAAVLQQGMTAVSVNAGLARSANVTIGSIDELQAKIKASKGSAATKQAYLDILESEKVSLMLQIERRQAIQPGMETATNELKTAMAKVKNLPADASPELRATLASALRKKRIALMSKLKEYQEMTTAIQTEKDLKRGEFGYTEYGSICLPCLFNGFTEQQKLQTPDDVLIDKIRGKVKDQTGKLVKSDDLKKILGYYGYAEILADPTKSAEDKAKDIAAGIVPYVGCIKDFAETLTALDTKEKLNQMKVYADWYENEYLQGKDVYKDPSNMQFNPMFISGAGSISVLADKDSQADYYLLDRLYYEQYGETWPGMSSTLMGSKFKSITYEEYLNSD